MAKGKFREQADDMNFALSMLHNSAIKKAMAAGVPYNEALNGAIAAYKRANPKPGSDK